MRRAGKQRRRRHDLAGLAIAALDDFQVEPGPLHLRAGDSGADAFDGGDGLGPDRADRQQAGSHRLAIDMHCAGAALGDAAAELRACHPEHVAQDPEQRHVVGSVVSPVLAVDFQCRHGSGLLSDLTETNPVDDMVALWEYRNGPARRATAWQSGVTPAGFAACWQSRRRSPPCAAPSRRAAARPCGRRSG